MKFSLKPLNGLLLAGLMATVGASAMAQTPTAPPATGASSAGWQAGPDGGHRMMNHHRMGEHRMGQRDPAKMQAWVAKRLGELKAKLRITASQEGAWTTFTAAMQPPANMWERPSAEQRAEQRAEYARMTTPERIDKMRAMRTQRMTDMTAAMDKRADATKAFYAALSPEQQKTFDAEQLKMMQRFGHHRHQDGKGGWGGMGGMGMQHRG